jgi:hypothetical protein
MRLTLLALMLLLATLAAPTSTPAAAGSAAPTQRDWMVGLVEGLGWSFGLPDQPRDADYLNILDGNRTLRVEAEAARQPGDAVAVKSFRTFGPFSGEGWLSGIATPTEAHLRFLLPCSGTYQVTAALRLPGFRIRLGDRDFAADGQEQFTTVALGEVELPAGVHEVQVSIPPNGAIDYLELYAPPLMPVHPLTGWDPGRPLSQDDLAVSAARALGLEPWLPPAGTETPVEAEASATLEGVTITDATHLGAPSGGSWLRAGAAPAEIRLTFTPPEPGVYTLILRGAAESPVTGVLNDRFHLTVTFPPYLQNVAAGAWHLGRQPSTLLLRLPPRSGLDLLLLAAHRSTGADYRRLLGLPDMGESPPTPEQMDRLLAMLAAIGAPR